jgi:hypothetical protein
VNDHGKYTMLCVNNFTISAGNLGQRTYYYCVSLVRLDQQLAIFLQQTKPLLVIPPDCLHASQNVTSSLIKLYVTVIVSAFRSRRQPWRTRG